MKPLTLAIVFLFILRVSYSQTFFSIIPDLGGDEMEGRFYNVIPLENDIKVIGLVHDSIVPWFHGGTWPVLSSFSYSGEILNTNYLVDSLYLDGFYYSTRRILIKNDSIAYLYDRRDLGNPRLDAYLIEFNYRAGRILRSKVVLDEISSHSDFVAQDIYLRSNGTLYLINSTNQSGPHPQILTVLDSTFNVTDQVFIPNYGRDNFTKYIEEDMEGNLVLVGTSRGSPNSVWFETKLFRQVLDSSFNSIDFKLALTNKDQSIVLADSYPVIKSTTGDWIFATQVVVETSDCQGCSIWVPYIVSVSSDFSSVNWETQMFEGDLNSSEPLLLLNSITEVDDGYIFCGSKDGPFGPETSGFLGKVSLTGDSLWTKHFIPIEWDTTQGRWFKWQDIKTTPLGNIVISGHASDSYSARILPWLLHLDADGCLEPGCNITSLSNTAATQEFDINIFPNPASRQCNIHIIRNHHQREGIKLRITNTLGNNVMEKILSGADTNYILNFDLLNSGNYFVQILDQGIPIITKTMIIIK